MTTMAEIARWRLSFSVLAIGFAVSHLGFPVALAQTPASEDTVQSVLVADIPFDATMVIAASVLAMRGRDDSKTLAPVVVAPAAKAALSEPAFRYDGFTLTGIWLTNYAVTSPSADAVSVDALLGFADAVGRHATISLAADYGVAPRKIEVKSASAVTVAAESPLVRLSVVPATAFPDGVLSPELDWPQLARVVADKALTPEAAKRLPLAPEDLYVFAFFQDRLPPDAEVQIRVSETPEGIAGDPSFSTTMDFDGWRVAAMRAKLALGTGTEFFFKAIYRPGSPLPAAERTPRPVAMLSSHLKSTGKGGSP